MNLPLLSTAAHSLPIWVKGSIRVSKCVNLSSQLDNGWNSSFAVEKARTMVFGLIVFFELFFALSCRSFTHTINKLGFFGNKVLLYSLLGESFAIVFIMNYPVMQRLFDFVSLQAAD